MPASGCVNSNFDVRAVARSLLLLRVAMIGAASIQQESKTKITKAGGWLQTAGDSIQEGTMLVLTRKRSEMIQIGENVVIKVLQTGRSTVKIGIEAPDDVRVIRAELACAPAPGHPLAAFLQERREIKHGKMRIDPKEEKIVVE